MPETNQRRSLIKVNPQDVPCTSSDILPDLPVITFDDFRKQIDEGVMTPWTVNRVYEQDCVRIELYDNQDSIAKFTVDVDTGLEFTHIFVQLANS